MGLRLGSPTHAVEYVTDSPVHLRYGWSVIGSILRLDKGVVLSAWSRCHKPGARVETVAATQSNCSPGTQMLQSQADSYLFTAVSRQFIE